MRNLILFILSTLAFLIHPLSLSAQNSFSLSLDVNSATGDQAVTSLNTSPDQVIAIQIFGKDIQNATGVSVRFAYDAGQVTYEGFDTGTVLPNANALTEQGTNPTFVKIGVVSFGGQATVNEGLIGTIRFRTLAAFSGSAIRLVRGELARGGQIESRALDLRVALQKLPTSFSLSLDVNDSAGDQGVTSAIVSANEGVAVQVFGDDMEGANSLVARFEYDAAQVSYEGFDAGTVLPNAQVTHQQGSSFVEVSITSSGQATANSGLVGTIRFRTSATFSGSAIRLARAVLARGGQSQSRTLDLRVALQKVFPMSFSLSLDVNSSSGNQGVISATMSEDEVVAIQVFGDDMEGANSFVVRFEYDRGQVVYDRFDAGTVLPNARVTHQQGSTFVEVSLTTSGQATDNSGLVGTIRFRTLRGFSGSAIRLARADLARVRGQIESRTLNLRIALQKALPTSFSLSLDVNSAGGDQSATSAIVSTGEGVAIQIFGEDLLGASGVSLRFKYDAAQVAYESFDAGAVLPNAQATRQQGLNSVEVSLTTSGQATANSGLVGTIRFRTLAASSSAIRLVRADLTRGGQTQSRTLNLQVALQRALPTSFSLSLDVNSAGGDQSVTSAVVSAGEGVAIQIFGEDLLGATDISLRFEYDGGQVAYEGFDTGTVLPNAQATRQQGSDFVEISLTSSGQATSNSGLVGMIRFRTLNAFSGSAIRLARADLARGGQTQRRTLNLRVALQRALPTSFSLSLDVNRSSGDQSVTSAIVSAGAGVAIQVFGEDLLGAADISLRFEYDGGQVAYEGFDTGTVLPNAQVGGRQQGSDFVKLDIVSLGGRATVNSGIIGTIHFRTLAAFSGSAVRLVSADLVRGGQNQSMSLNLRVALQRALPTSFSLSLDVNSAGGDQSVTSAVVSAGEGVAIQIFGEDLLGASGVSLRFEYNAAQVVYESFDAGAVLPNAQTTHQQGSAYVEISLTSSGQATVNSGLIGTIRFRTLTGFSGSAIRLVRADLVRGGQTQSAPLNLRVELQVSIFIPPSPDFDGDGGVGISDFLFFVDVFGTQEGQAGYESKYDLDSNGTIGIPDFLIFVDNFGKEVSSPSSGGSGGSGGDATQVAIPDANLRSSIEDALGKASGAPITRAEMSTLTNFEAENANIRNLTGLEFAISLIELDLSRNSITDVSALSDLTNLIWLNLYLNAITDVSALSGLTSLNTLILSHNAITDVSALSGLTNLKRLFLHNNSIRDVSALSGLTNLNTLTLSFNSISDVSSLSGLTSLIRLELSGNSISNVSALSGLTNLQDLSLRNNAITDVSVLSGLTNLGDLYLSGNSISDVSVLSGLTNLRNLGLAENNITDVSALSGLTNLTWLNLGNNSISDVSVLSGLTNLTWLDLGRNSISDVSALSGLTNLGELYLSSNRISDLAPLIANTGLGSGDRVFVSGNPLSAISINMHIPALQSRGVDVRFGASKPAVEQQRDISHFDSY